MTRFTFIEYKCDRCGGKSLVPTKNKIGFHRIEYDVRGSDMTTEVIDVCESCYSKFMEWVKNG